MEAQAVDRLYRLGQANEVHVYRYYVQGTLEMNIHQVQRRKGELALYVYQTVLWLKGILKKTDKMKFAFCFQTECAITWE